MHSRVRIEWSAFGDIVGRTEALADLAAGSREPKGPLRVNAPVPFVLHAIAPRLPAFLARYPAIDLTLDMTDDVVDLIGAHADVAIRFGTLADSDLLQRRLGTTPWRLVASPAYLDRTGWPKTPADLVHLAQVRFSSPDHINILRFKGLAAPVEVPVALCASNGEAVRRLVLAGCGIARFSDLMIRDDIASGRLVELFARELIAEPLDITAVYLTRISGLRRLAAFVDWLEEIIV